MFFAWASFLPQEFCHHTLEAYNTGAPNKWTAHYKSYFLHLSSRISGRYPDLRESEYIISLLEKIRPKKEHETIRPRGIYFDDKHEQFTVFADYLVPHDQDPSLSPKDFDAVLKDGEGLHSDSGGMWYITYWDIQVQQIHPHSDHFDLDHYDFYNPVRGNFENGRHRGDYTIGELAEYCNNWL